MPARCARHRPVNATSCGCSSHQRVSAFVHSRARRGSHAVKTSGSVHFRVRANRAMTSRRPQQRRHRRRRDRPPPPAVPHRSGGHRRRCSDWDTRDRICSSAPAERRPAAVVGGSAVSRPHVPRRSGTQVHAVTSGPSVGPPSFGCQARRRSGRSCPGAWRSLPVTSLVIAALVHQSLVEVREHRSAFIIRRWPVLRSVKSSECAQREHLEQACAHGAGSRHVLAHRSPIGTGTPWNSKPGSGVTM